MSKHLVIGVDWYGPYTRNQAAEAKSDFGPGLYFAIGMPKGKGNYIKRPQYIGMTTGNVVTRALNPQHQVMRALNFEGGLWFGEISTAEPSGKKTHVAPSTLRYAEWLHVFFMALPQNTNLNRPPPKPATVLNRWWRTDYETPRQQRPHPLWPDLIDFTGTEYRSRSVWFGGRQVVHRL